MANTVDNKKDVYLVHYIACIIINVNFANIK